MAASVPLREVRARLARDVAQACSRIPPEVAHSAIGTAVAVDTLVAAAAEIARRQGGLDLLCDVLARASR